MDPNSVWWGSTCNGMNDAGHVVGTFLGPQGTHGFLWRNTAEGMVDLNFLIPPDSGLTLSDAANINARDQITSYVTMEDGLHAVLLTPVTCGQGCLSAPSGLVGWWTANGVTTDAVSGRDATAVGDVKFFPAVVKKGFVLDGRSGYLDAPDTPDLHTITSGVTMAAWINPKVPAPPSGQGYLEGNILSRRDPMVSDGISFFVNSNGVLGFQFTTAGGSGVSPAYGLPNLFDGTWKHVAMTADTETGLVTFYYNGEQYVVDAPAGLSGPFADVSHLFIGHRQSNDTPEGVDGASPFKGMLDEVQLFNRVLTPQEIGAIYHAGTKGLCK